VGSPHKSFLVAPLPESKPLPWGSMACCSPPPCHSTPQLMLENWAAPVTACMAGETTGDASGLWHWCSWSCGDSGAGPAGLKLCGVVPCQVPPSMTLKKPQGSSCIFLHRPFRDRQRGCEPGSRSDWGDESEKLCGCRCVMGSVLKLSLST